MMLSATHIPKLDPTPIFELFRGSFATELLTAAVAHLNLFAKFAAGPKSIAELRQELELEERPATVLLTAMRAMQLLETDEEERLRPTELAAEHLLPDSPFNVSDYIGLAAESPGVVEMVERLRSNRPANSDDDQSGVAFIYRDGLDSAMEQAASARHLTLSLAGRAKNVAPVLAQNLNKISGTLLDVGGGTGIYCIACLQANTDLTGIVFDRPEVLKVADEFAREYGVVERLNCHSGDMFSDPLPAADTILLSNVLHDWDTPECRRLIQRCADSLNPGGRLLIHDVYLNDQHDGPLPIALYSAALFTLTEGRAYSALEYSNWLQEAGLTTDSQVVPTLVHCGVLTGTKD